MNRAKRIALVLVAFVTPVASALAGWEWELLTPPKPPPMGRPVLVHDPLHSDTLLLSGADQLYPWGGYTSRGTIWRRVEKGWKELEGSKQPGNPINFGAVFDPKRKVIVAYGGGPTTYPGKWSNTREWDGRQWRLIQTPNDPGNATTPAIAFDNSRQQVAIYEDATLWYYDGNNWNLADASGPISTGREHLAFDGKSDRLVLFGGLGEGTWGWTGERWTLITDGGPSWASNMVYDEGRGVLVLVGANEQDTGQNRETWELRGGSWQLVDRVDKYQALGQGAVYVPDLHGILTFGGFDVIETTDREELWDGKSWTILNGGPISSRGAIFGYDPLRDRIVYSGGWREGPNYLDESWVFENGDWRRIEPKNSPGAGQWMFTSFDQTIGRFLIHYRWRGLADVRTFSFDGEVFEELGLGPDVSLGLMYFHPVMRATFLSDHLGNWFKFRDGNWTPASVTGLPPDYAYFDPLRNEMMGVNWQSVLRLRGNNWVPFVARLGSVRDGERAVFFPDKNQLIFIGGTHGWLSPRTSWISVWDGLRWFDTRVSGAGPGATEHPYAAYDSNRRRAVVMGSKGSSALWSLRFVPN